MILAYAHSRTTILLMRLLTTRKEDCNLMQASTDPPCCGLTEVSIYGGLLGARQLGGNLAIYYACFPGKNKQTKYNVQSTVRLHG